MVVAGICAHSFHGISKLNCWPYIVWVYQPKNLSAYMQSSIDFRLQYFYVSRSSRKCNRFFLSAVNVGLFLRSHWIKWPMCPCADVLLFAIYLNLINWKHYNKFLIYVPRHTFGANVYVCVLSIESAWNCEPFNATITRTHAQTFARASKQTNTAPARKELYWLITLLPGWILYF